MKILAISPGDPAGIGPDLCIKAFAGNKPLNYLPVIFSDPEVFQERANKLNKKIHTLEYSETNLLPQKNTLFFSPVKYIKKVKAGIPNSQNSPSILLALREAAQRTIKGEFHGLVTGPINKKIINDSGIPFQGHTEFLAKESNTNKVVMLLTNGLLKIALATTHIPLHKVSKMITKEHISDCLHILHHDLQTKWSIKKPKIKVLGLNPHAGEGGYIGKEDKNILMPVIQQLNKSGFNIIGPESADTAFIDNRMKNIDAVLAMYHDQGLPVIKTIGFGQIVNITLGLPFIRTSVDHGTAYDLAGTKKADERSLLEASNLASSIRANKSP